MTFGAGSVLHALSAGNAVTSGGCSDLFGQQRLRSAANVAACSAVRERRRESNCTWSRVREWLAWKARFVCRNLIFPVLVRFDIHAAPKFGARLIWIIFFFFFFFFKILLSTFLLSIEFLGVSCWTCPQLSGSRDSDRVTTSHVVYRHPVSAVLLSFEWWLVNKISTVTLFT